MKNFIRTTIDPKQIRAQRSRVLVRHPDDIKVTATAQIFNEEFDPTTKTWNLEMGLDYPVRSTVVTATHMVFVLQDGLKFPIKRPEYMMTQEDFDAAITRGEVITVPIVD